MKLERYKLEQTTGGIRAQLIEEGPGKGGDGHVKIGRGFGRKIAVETKNGKIMKFNRGSLIDYLNKDQSKDPKLSKGWFFGLFGGASKDEILERLDKNLQNSFVKGVSPNQPESPPDNPSSYRPARQPKEPIGTARAKAVTPKERAKLVCQDLRHQLQEEELKLFRTTSEDEVKAVKEMATAIDLFSQTGSLESLDQNQVPVRKVFENLVRQPWFSKNLLDEVTQNKESPELGKAVTAALDLVRDLTSPSKSG